MEQDHLSISFLLLILTTFLHFTTGQDCNEGGGGGGFVGFTALTPEQLRKTIQDSVQSSVSEVLASPSDLKNDNGCCSDLLVLNKSLNALDELGSTLEKSVETAVHRAVLRSVTGGIETYIQSAISEAVVNLTQVIQQSSVGSPTSPPQTPPTTPPTFPQNPTALPPRVSTCSPGSSPTLPASSCKLIYNLNSSSLSGFYWIGGEEGPPQRLYCDMEKTCGGVVGGWTRLANIDMTNVNHSCPSNLVEVSPDPKRPRLCTLPSSVAVGCSSTIFPTHGVTYGHVCGRIFGYQDRTPNAFFPYHVNRSLTIDDLYLDGISLTYGSTPRKHIWSFASALDESGGHQSGCPCLNVLSRANGEIPPFIGNDYFCDTGSADDVKNIFYPDNPLWDGEGCGELNICCSFNNPPWFSKMLTHRVNDDVEMRICRDAGRLNEDIPIELVEIYVR